jgi:hypothetical protein
VPLCEARPILEAEAARQLAAKLAAGAKPEPPAKEVTRRRLHQRGPPDRQPAAISSQRTICARILDLHLVH